MAFLAISDVERRLCEGKFIADSEIILAVKGSLKHLVEKGFCTCFEKQNEE